jgi:hypothetical protein
MIRLERPMDTTTTAEKVPLLNLAQRCRAREVELEAAAAAKQQIAPYEPTPQQRREWAAQLTAEYTDAAARGRRDSLVQFYSKHAAFRFPLVPFGVQTGAQCVALLKAGGPIAVFHRAQGSGEWLASWGRR